MPEGVRSVYVFVSERLAPLSVAGYQRMVARAGEAAGFPFLVHSHMLRHSCGYKLANDGQDTRAIQHYLGHRSITSTVRYTALAPDRDQWNERLSDLVIGALPVNQTNAEAVSDAGSAVAAGIVDMKPADPIEGMLISQLVVANEAALKLYQLAWLNNAEYFEATKYLQLADRASRTVAMLSERLDHHRNRGQQQIIVQHTTTVNANQAVVTDSVVTGNKNEAAPSAKLLAAVTDKPMEIIEAKQKEAVLVGGRDTKAK
jgi:hypothetical protein